MPAWPVRVDGKPPRVAPSPILGEHTGNVLRTWLGLSAAEVEALRGEAIVSSTFSRASRGRGSTRRV